MRTSDVVDSQQVGRLAQPIGLSARGALEVGAALLAVDDQGSCGTSLVVHAAHIHDLV